MSEHKLPFTVRAERKLLGVTRRQQRAQPGYEAALAGTFTPVPVTPGSNKWRRQRAAAAKQGTESLRRFEERYGTKAGDRPSQRPGNATRLLRTVRNLFRRRAG